MTKEDKIKLAETAKVSIKKEYGTGSIMNSNDVSMNVDVISTGSIGLDIALGIGGLPKGRIVELYGQESSGKTTLATHVIAEAQKKGGLCAVIDAEQAFDFVYAEQIGVNASELDISQPDSGEEGLDIANKLICSGAYDVIVIDSVAALVPKRELEGSFGDSNMGIHAKLMSQAMRILTASIKKSNTLVIFINQLRQKMVLMGNPDVTTGGLALKFYASVRLDIRRSLTTDNTVFGEDKEKIGNQTTVHVIKNKLAPPFKKAEFDILYGVGIDKIGELIHLGNQYKILKKWGSTITLEDGTKHELSVFASMLRDNPEYYEKLKAQIIDISKVQ